MVMKINKLDKKTIEALKKYFTISTAAFQFMHVVTKTYGSGKAYVSTMETLHHWILDELNNENPNKTYINHLLANMEKLVKSKK
jgi:hypothetical protein